MHCAKCGSPNPDNATACGSCGASLANPYGTAQARGPINNYLIPAIFSTVCCCLPLGIVSIVYAAQVNGKLSGGDVAGAQESANKAKMWFWIAFGLGLLVNALVLIVQILGAVIAVQENQPGGGF